MKTIFTLAITLLTMSNVSAQTVCVGANCNPVEVYQERGEGIESLGDYKSYRSNRYAPTKENHKEIVQKAGTDRETNPFRPQIESSDSLKLHELSIGVCLVERSHNPQAFYKIVELDRSSGMIRYVRENEIHENMLYSKVVFFNRDEANDLKNMRKWPCSRTPHLADQEYVQQCAKEMTASGTHYCPERSRYNNSKFVK